MHKREIDATLIDRYLQGKLTPQELEQVEMRIMEDPVFFHAVQEADQLHQGLQDNADMLENDLLEHNVLAFEAAPPWRNPYLAIAASLCVGILAGALLFNAGDGRGIDAARGLALSSVVRLETTRGDINDTVLDGSMPHLLQVDTGLSLSAGPWQLTLTNDQGTSVEHAIAADGNGMLNFVTPLGLQGSYTLRINQQGSDAVTEYVLVFN